MEDSLDSQILSLLRNPAKIEEGFRLLLAQYQERMYWHIRRMVLHHEDANDVLQNVLIKVYRNIDKYEGKSKLYTWLYRIATNETLTFLQKQKRNTSVSLEQEMSNLADTLKADKYFDGAEAEIKLQQALLTLPEKQKLVFTLRYYEGLSYQEIADVVATSVGGLKASYHHAVKKIEQFILGNEA